MLLGLLADIHEAVEPLREALDLFARHRVDAVVHVGDICHMLERLDDTVALLAQARVAGVWGNHDFGLCRDVDDDMRRRFSPAVIEYMGTLQPTLSVEDCLFTHVEPWLDANDLMQLWYFEGPPDTAKKLARSFDAVPQRVLFSGHMHRWLLGTPRGMIEWDGTTPVRLAPPGRYLVVLHALVRGHCALYDTNTGDLVPLRVTAMQEDRTIRYASSP
jgi:predicted phosphodiesterase